MQKNKRNEVGPHRGYAVSNDRLHDLLSEFSDLQRDSQQLLARLLESIREMRQLRAQLQEQRAQDRANGRTPGRGSYLQERYGLTRRELEVAALLAQGHTNTAIAKALQISTHTARHIIPNASSVSWGSTPGPPLARSSANCQ